MKKFKNKRACELFCNEDVRGVPPDVMVRVHDRLRLVASLSDLRDLQMFPSMKLERLKGDRKGQYSVRD